MSPLLYAVLCVVLPLAWGVMVVVLSNRLEGFIARRRARDGKPPRDLPPTEYHI